MAGPAILWKAGVRIALHTDHPVVNQKWLRFCAGLAMRYGLPEEEALKAVTINTAQIARVADRVGTVVEDAAGVAGGERERQIRHSDLTPHEERHHQPVSDDS